MNGQMMQQPLLISSLLVHAERHHGEQRDRLAPRRRRHPPLHLPRPGRALAPHGQGAGRAGRASRRPRGHAGLERLPPHGAVLRGHRGTGAVLHTLNPRLHPDQIVYIADHAEDQVLFFDLTFLPLIEAVAGRVKTIKALRRHDRPRAHAGGQQGRPTCCATRSWSTRRTTASTGPRSTRTPPARCATPRAPPATPRACSTATARPCCTPTPRRCPTR